MMIILVTANNYLLMFVGWEGVGVCSYLLVSFWFTRIAANQSSISAFLANRVGDCFLTIGMFAILWCLGNLDYATVFSLAPYINSNVVIVIGICLLIGAMAKSSQVGLHIWLPMAMEGPTPVSALIHAATMVTAGVYLLMRSSPLIEYSSTVLLLCLWLGAITTVFSSLIGLFQQDIKKIIAYSTMSPYLKAQKYIVYYNIFRHLTICVDAVFISYLNIANSQITKACDYLCQLLLRRSHNHCNFRFFSSSTIIWLYLYIMSGLIRWKFEIISKLVGISETIRWTLIFFKLKLINFNLMSKSFIDDAHAPYAAAVSLQPSPKNHMDKPLPQSSLLKKKPSFLVFSRKMSTKIRTDSLNEALKAKKDLAFNEWLAGLIDGDGNFALPKNGNHRFDIIMDARDKKVLFLIKQKYGGSIKEISNGHALRYRLRNERGLTSLIHDINGLIRNPTRLLQMSKLCRKFHIELKNYEDLTFDNGWFSGFIDSDGSIYYKESSWQVFIGITQKNKFLLDPLILLYGGRIDVCGPKREGFEYVIYRKRQLMKLIYKYFNKYPLRTEKMKRVNLIEQFYLVKLNEKNEDDWAENLQKWVKFKDKWENFRD